MAEFAIGLCLLYVFYVCLRDFDISKAEEDYQEFIRKSENESRK